MKLKRLTAVQIPSEYVKLSGVNFGAFAEDLAGDIYAYVGDRWINSSGVSVNSFDIFVRPLPYGTQFVITSEKH